MNKFLLLFFMSSLVGCGDMVSSPPSHESLGVNALGVDGRLVPNIKNKAEASDLGPAPEGQMSLNVKKDIQKVPAVSLILGPGLNRVRCYIPILKLIEKEGVNLHILSGSGMSAVLASLYAMGMTPDKIEWLFHKFSRRAVGIKPFRAEWMSLVDEIFLTQLKGKQIQNTKKRLIVPLLNVEKGKVVYLTRGDLYWSLVQHLKLIPGKKKSNYMAPFHKEIYNYLEMKKLGADIVFGLDVLGSSIGFDDVDHFLIGTYGKAASIAKRESEGLDIFQSIDDISPNLDSSQGMPKYLQSCRGEGFRFAKRLKDHVSAWSGKEKVEN